MKYNNTIFNQLLNMLPRYQFEQDVVRKQVNRYTKHFTVWNQLLVNLYAQVSGKKSLRDIETGLKMHQNAWYHLGLVNAARSTIFYVNSKNPYQIAEDTFYYLYEKCRDITPKHKFRCKSSLYTLDASVIDFCLTMFSWAKFRKSKGYQKYIHFRPLGITLSFLVITDAKQHDVKVEKNLFLPLSLTV